MIFSDFYSVSVSEPSQSVYIDDIVVADMVDDMVADMKVHMLADMEVDNVADMENWRWTRWPTWWPTKKIGRHGVGYGGAGRHVGRQVG